jgi:hypothetical protein
MEMNANDSPLSSSTALLPLSISTNLICFDQSNETRSFQDKVERITPKRSPKLSPKLSPKMSPKLSPKKSPKSPKPNYGVGSVSIDFPPGPMGLELEPVIISSAREIGCKVKDFYFGVDHYGIDPVVLEESVSIGDVITFIGQQNVQSAKFIDTLELLRSLKDSNRMIVFKNISTSCK